MIVVQTEHCHCVINFVPDAIKNYFTKFMKNWLWHKNGKTQLQQNKKSNIKTRNRELNPGRLTANADVIPLHHRQLRVTIVVKLFNCFDAKCRNVTKQRPICGPHNFNIFFWNILTCMDYCIWQVFILTGLAFTA